MKKLVLKKDVVSSLNDDQLARLKGGAGVYDDPTYTETTWYTEECQSRGLCDTYNQCPMTLRYDCVDTYDQCPMTQRYDCGLPKPVTFDNCR